MNEPSDPEELLTALLAGDRQEHEPEVQAAFGRWPWLPGRLQKLRALAKRLDARGADDRATLTAGLATPSPHEAAVPATVRRQLGRSTPIGRWLALAAAVLLGSGLTIWALQPPAADHRSMLELSPGELWPTGGVDSWSVFRWHLVTPPQGSYVVRFRAADGSGTELFAARVTVPEWRPTSEDLPKLRPRMLWEVEVLDAASNVASVAGPVSVWRR